MAGCRCAGLRAAFISFFAVLFLECHIHTLVTCVNRTVQVQASFFGVGAPEAVLVGLVALVIFGPQGLAEVRVHIMQSVLYVMHVSCKLLLKGPDLRTHHGPTRLLCESCTDRQPRQLARQSGHSSPPLTS